MKKKCLFLGYDSTKTKLISAIKNFDNKKWDVIVYKKKLTINKVKNFDSIISFGYKHIIKKEIIDLIKVPIINLHLSYLPFNRGSDPNYWSFIERTPSGVSIIKINFGIDTGEIIYKKLINFNFKKKTFNQTYQILFEEIENLFIKNIHSIMNNNFKSKKQVGQGTFHKKKDLNKINMNWNINIFSYLKKNKYEVKLSKRNVSLKHSKLIYEWITERMAIKNSFNEQKSISYNSHLKWLKDNLNNKSIDYWVFYNLSVPFGLVRFNKKKSNAVLSYSISKLFRGKGLSYLMLNSAIQSFFSKNKSFDLYAYVRIDNSQSIRILENINFKILKKNRKKVTMIYEK